MSSRNKDLGLRNYGVPGQSHLTAQQGKQFLGWEPVNVPSKHTAMSPGDGYRYRAFLCKDGSEAGWEGDSIYHRSIESTVESAREMLAKPKYREQFDGFVVRRKWLTQAEKQSLGLGMSLSGGLIGTVHGRRS